jgi:hypothetical protein
MPADSFLDMQKLGEKSALARGSLFCPATFFGKAMT